jgi:hypothetical protein
MSTISTACRDAVGGELDAGGRRVIFHNQGAETLATVGVPDTNKSVQSYDEAVFMWDVRRAQVMRSLPAHSDPVAGIDVGLDGR